VQNELDEADERDGSERARQKCEDLLQGARSLPQIRRNEGKGALGGDRDERLY
jgi:hypothetical protein